MLETIQQDGEDHMMHCTSQNGEQAAASPSILQLIDLTPELLHHILDHMLDKDNQGLQHIRKLILRDYDELSETAEVKDYPDVALLVHFLPRNILREFR
ncbi:MAG: hypothetical protein Q9213_006676 [Squamulea squamosa]